MFSTSSTRRTGTLSRRRRLVTVTKVTRILGRVIVDARTAPGARTWGQPVARLPHRSHLPPLRPQRAAQRPSSARHRVHDRAPSPVQASRRHAASRRCISTSMSTCHVRAPSALDRFDSGASILPLDQEVTDLSVRHGDAVDQAEAAASSSTRPPTLGLPFAVRSDRRRVRGRTVQLGQPRRRLDAFADAELAAECARRPRAAEFADIRDCASTRSPSPR